MQIPLVVLFSKDVEELWDVQMSAAQRVASFEKSLGVYVQGYFTAMQAHDKIIQPRGNVWDREARSITAATTGSVPGENFLTVGDVASAGSRETRHANHVTYLISLITQEIKLLQDTRFHSRDNGEYLCKTGRLVPGWV